METPQSNEHLFPIKVIASDIDELNHVNNIVYLRYVQEAAGNHWHTTVPENLSAQIIWVVRRHEIDYLKPAFLGDELTVKTWVDNFTGVTSDRHCEIWRGPELLARSRTIWVSLDAGTFRPKRIGEEIASLFFGSVKE
ncbi:thioesterase family protein [Emticicia sp. TH156]|uniref:acyl-CoA thioesterase n=1 Tax=Emticicia sp. TH156 TaxID=2067454 RepID=UPI000C76FAEC|nr:thioesterase family protein [Emticicia sp. TH156]PLK46014.1 acyl-CoA thioesterase [Emticicia sp. TH156]